jgi:hypothetical protein
VHGERQARWSKARRHFGTAGAFRSTIEERPADLISESLVVQHELADLVRKLCTLPLALHTTRLVTFTWASRRAHCPHGVGGRAQLVSCHMSHGRGLSSSMGRLPRGAGNIPGCGVRSERSLTGLRHRDLTTHPSMGQLNRPPRPVVPWLRSFKEVQYVPCAIGGPHGETLVIGVLKGATATHGHKSGISLFGEDHLSAHLLKTSGHRQDSEVTTTARLRLRQPGGLVMGVRFSSLVQYSPSPISSPLVACPHAAIKLVVVEVSPEGEAGHDAALD